MFSWTFTGGGNLVEGPLRVDDEWRGMARGTERHLDHKAQNIKSTHKSVRNEVRSASVEVRKTEVKIIRVYFINYKMAKMKESENPKYWPESRANWKVLDTADATILEAVLATEIIK